MSANYTPEQSPKSSASTQTSPSRYSKATHLTEFYPYLNGGSQSFQPGSLTNDKSGHSRQLSSTSQSINGRRPSFSTMNSFNSFSPSTLDLQTIVTKTDISKTTEAYNEILEASQEYKDALLRVAEAAGNLGVALENGAKCKGSGSAADGLLSASGLYFLVANHQQILAHSVKESFEIPVSKEINQFKLTSAKNEELFKNEIKEKILSLKKQERENAKLSKLKSRNLITYRSKLLQLTSHIDEIDKVKHDYYQTSFDLVQDTSQNILSQVGSIVRAQVEIYEGIARKGWSGGGLDELIAGCPDPFTNEEEEEEDQDENQDQQEGNDNDNDDDNNEYDDSVDTVDDDTIGPIPKLKEQAFSSSSSTTNGGGLILNKKFTIPSGTQPVLSHSQSTKSFEKTLNANDVIQSSTPKQNTPEPNFDDSIDDNSFSLPLPGSSSRNTLPRLVEGKNDILDKSKIKEEIRHESGNENGNEGEEIEDTEDEPEPRTKLQKELYPSHSEWRESDQDTSGNEDNLPKEDQ